MRNISVYTGHPNELSKGTKRTAVDQMIISSKGSETTGYAISDINDLSYATWEAVKHISNPLRELTWDKYHNIIVGSGIAVVSTGIAYIGYKAFKHISKKTNKEEEKEQ